MPFGPSYVPSPDAFRVTVNTFDRHHLTGSYRSNRWGGECDGDLVIIENAAFDGCCLQ
jgi:hypothetical protein